MKVVKKLAYILLALSLFPVITTYFAYGNIRDMSFLVVTLAFGVGLLYLAFVPSPAIATVVLVLGVCLFTIQLTQLNALWFHNAGGDRMVSVVFSLQAMLTVIVLLSVIGDSRVLERFRKQPH